MLPGLTEKLRFWTTGGPSKARLTFCTRMGGSFIMGGLYGFGFEVAELFGQESLDFFFAEAEMQGFSNELVEGGPDLAAARFDLERGRLMGHIGAETAPGFDKAF